MVPGGSLAICKKARSKGLVSYMGITSHKPRAHLTGITAEIVDFAYFVLKTWI
jgi:hypothetical protein